MLAEFEEIEQRYGVEKGADLRKACRYLLRHQFAYSGDRGVATIYNTLTDSRFRGVVEGLFDNLGYRLARNAEEQWIGILLDDEDSAALPKLRAEETMVLLVVASHWQDDADRGDLQDRAAAVTTLNTLHERYRDLVPPTKKPTISINRFREVLHDLADRNLLDIGEFDRDQQDHEVIIRSMIKLVSGDAPLRRIEGYVRAEEMRARPTATSISAAPIPEAAGPGAGGDA